MWQNNSGDKDYPQAPATSEDSAQSSQNEESVFVVSSIASSSGLSEILHDAAKPSLTPADTRILSSLADKSGPGDFGSSSGYASGTSQSGYHDANDTQKFSSTLDVQEKYSPFVDSSVSVPSDVVNSSTRAVPYDDQSLVNDRSSSEPNDSSKIFSHSGQNVTSIQNASHSKCQQCLHLKKDPHQNLQVFQISMKSHLEHCLLFQIQKQARKMLVHHPQEIQMSVIVNHP